MILQQLGVGAYLQQLLERCIFFPILVSLLLPLSDGQPVEDHHIEVGVQQEYGVRFYGADIQQHRLDRLVKLVAHQSRLDGSQGFRDRLFVQCKPAVGRLIGTVPKHLWATVSVEGPSHMRKGNLLTES